MTSAGIIAHRLHPNSGPPAGTDLLYWTAGNSVVQKLDGNGNWASSYNTGLNVRQGIFTDKTRNRVFVGVTSGVLVFEDYTIEGAIPAPTSVAFTNIGNSNSWTWNNAARLDPATGQAFFATGANDTVCIVNTDNSLTTVSGFDNVFYVWALGSGKFCVVDDFGVNLEVWGPSNGYASALVEEGSPDGATIGSTAYDSATNTMICYLQSDEGGLWLVNPNDGTSSMVDIDGHYGGIMYWAQDQGYVVINQTGQNGKIWVYEPYSGELVSTTDFTGEVVGTPSATIIDIKHIDNVLCTMINWTISGSQRAVMHLSDINTGAILGTYAVPTTTPGLPSKLGAAGGDYYTFTASHGQADKLYYFNAFDPYATGSEFQDTTGSTPVDYVYAPVS
jgi:hypothetical protein